MRPVILHFVERTRAGEAQILESVSRVLQGDHAAYAVVVREYQATVLRICGALLRNSQDAEDAAQEVFYRAFRSLATFRLERRFTPWLLSIAMNTARTYFRKSSRNAGRTAAVAPDDLPSSYCVEREGERQLMAESVRVAIGRLPERLRGVVVLYYLEELDVEDVSETLGLSRENVKSRLHRARALLRRFLTEDATEGYDRE